MTTRRGFLLLCGASGAGIFLANTGLIELPRRMVLQLAGKCSFCGKDRREVFGIAGVVGRSPRICDECVGLCFDILAEEAIMTEAEQAARVPPIPVSSGLTDEPFEKLLHSASSDLEVDPREIFERIKAQLSAPEGNTRATRYRDFHCSFCDRSRHDVRKLISGPRVFICDDCAGDAGGLLAASGWRVSVMSPANMKRLAEQTRKALQAATPEQIEELRKRHGIS